MARFTVYKLKTEYENKRLLERFFIVLQDGDNIRFTNFGKYAWSSTNKKRRIDSNNRMRCVNACQFLNYAFFDYIDEKGKRGIGSLDNLSVDVIQEFLNKYGLGKLPGDSEDSKRQINTINIVYNNVKDFIINFLEDKNSNCKIKSSDLFKQINKRSKKTGRTYKVAAPSFTVEMDPAPENPIIRDVPNDAFNILFKIIYQHHMNIFGIVFLQAFAGLRPADAVNVRRVDSILGPGILFTFRNNHVTKIQIDLRMEYDLRGGEIKSSSRTKQEKMRVVPPHCFQPFYESYLAYMEYLKDKTYDERYGPLCINKNGKAFRVDSYRETFEKIVRKELIPALLESEDPELVDYALVLKEHNLPPHIFRHYFTVQLILNGVTNAQDIAFYRGDSSLESATAYLMNKSEIEKRYKKISNETFDYMYDLSEKFLGDNNGFKSIY